MSQPRERDDGGFRLLRVEKARTHGAWTETLFHDAPAASQMYIQVDECILVNPPRLQ